MEKHIIRMSLDKETKGTFRYREESGDKPEVMGTSYLKKWAIGNPPVKRIKVTVEPDVESAE